jgi:TetR/AcrR family transcriptional repressor of nem operon
MTKESTKFRILSVGAQIVYEKGFNNTGIQEILKAAEVPKGSFYFYFESKEDFGLELIDYFVIFFEEMMEKHLKSTEPSYLKRLKDFFNEFLAVCEANQYKAGCPIGNLTQEMGGLSQAFQAKLKGVFNRMSAGIGRCLELASQSGEIDPSLDPYETADFIVNSWEGALLRMKAERSLDPLVTFDKMIFQRVLK